MYQIFIDNEKLSPWLKLDEAHAWSKVLARLFPNSEITAIRVN